MYAVSCKKHHCGAYGCAHQTKKNAVAYWNTRAPILSAGEMEKIYGKENPFPSMVVVFRPKMEMLEGMT